VADPSYQNDKPLTYSSSQRVEPGTAVTVPLRQKNRLGLVVSLVPKPRFAVKPILQALPRPLPLPLIKLHDWMKDYYPAPSGTITQLFVPGLPSAKPYPNDPISRTETTMPPLTPEQRNVLDAIKSPGLYLLHGDTGSGKTRIYLELARQNFQKGRSSIILTPEIGLTSQLTRDFQSLLGERVVTMHSGLSELARRQRWQWLLEQTDPVVVIGARSAIFSPLANVGLIVVDESHETAYKQDQAPYYHVAPVAAKLASLHNASLLLGSATPLVSDYFVAGAKGRPILRMSQTAAGGARQEIVPLIVDIKDRQQFKHSPYLSQTLIDLMAERLKKHEQILLFLNRRGTARVVFCEKCGWQASCPECNLPLVYHHDQYIVRCHTCSFKAPTPASCPACRSAGVVFKSVGTKAIADEAQRLFPEAKVMRFDTDNKKNERLETNYTAVHAGEVDIIVGTQTLAKGLDLPMLGLVGVVIADTGLYFPDFSAQERTYQLLTQVIGRVGRGHRQGNAVIQTYTPHSPLLKAILSKNWSTFYNSELEERRRFLFPPFCYMLKLTCKRASSQSSQKAATQLAAKLAGTYPNIKIEGPAPAFHEQVQNKFAWQIVVKSRNRTTLTSILRQLPSGWSYDIDPMNLL